MVTMVVIKCPETDQEIPTGIVTDLTRFDRLGEGYATLQCPYSTSPIGGRGLMPTGRLRPRRRLRESAGSAYLVGEIVQRRETSRLFAHELIYIHEMSVRPSARRKGVGGSLLDAAKAHGRS